MVSPYAWACRLLVARLCGPGPPTLCPKRAQDCVGLWEPGAAHPACSAIADPPPPPPPAVACRRCLPACCRDLHTGTALTSFKSNACPPNGLSLLGRDYLVAAQLGRGGGLHFWAWHKDQPHQRSFAAEALTAVAATRDGAFCAAGGASGAVFVWEASSGRLLRTWPAHYKVGGGRLATPPCFLCLLPLPAATRVEMLRHCSAGGASLPQQLASAAPPTTCRVTPSLLAEPFHPCCLPRHCRRSPAWPSATAAVSW